MIPKNIIDKVINQVKVFLPEVNLVTETEIENNVNFVTQRQEYSEYDLKELNLLVVKELKTHYTMVPEGFRILELNDPQRKRPWVDSKKVNKELWQFWSRYKNFLLYKEGFSAPVIDELDRLTDKILDGLYDPSVKIGFDKKGLVVGQVQSGKTSNYTGLICKAADTGYNLIIVLAGLHNNLRSQTQLRIDKGFLGFDTQFQRAFNTGQHLIGVGIGSKGIPAHSMTDSSEKGDFSKKSASVSFQTKEPIIAVVKKNSSVLNKLYQWLSNYASDFGDNKLIHEKAILIIDDEADNASVNTKKNPEERTAINGWIRDILSLFAKNAYVGYTATPFANVFIPSTERNDLFPRDFIINIPPPPKYIGPDKVFGFDYYNDEVNTDNGVLPICVRIDNNEREELELKEFSSGGGKEDDSFSNEIPASLKTAIKCFIISCAIRRLRGQGKEHNSMLIHVARYKKWQKHVKELVESEFKKIKNGIDYNDSLIIEELRQAYEVDTNDYKSYKTISNYILNSSLKEIDSYIQVHTWNEVKAFLYEAAVNIKVREINGSSADVLDYYENREQGLSVIAVGGDKLSRGLTLEGLTISYFMRASKMYDTLMQMGRWFGYRPGYVDLCRLFTTKELNEWFCHISRATQELRDEFDYMHDIKASPDKYAIKVRTHPQGLQISASNKIRSAEYIDISWAGRLVESYELIKDYEITKTNLNSIKKLISKLHNNFKVKDIEKSGTRVWFDVRADLIIEMLENFIVYENLKAYSPENQIRFIKNQIKNNELTAWRVALMSNSVALKEDKLLIEGKDVGFFRRTASEDSTARKYFIKKSHIIDKTHESIDLDTVEYDKAFKLTKERWKRKNSTPQTPTGDIIRNEIRNPQNPLLLLYLLRPSDADPDNKYGGINWDIPFVGYAISYPKSDFFEPVRFAISKTLLPYYDEESNTLDFDDEE